MTLDDKDESIFALASERDELRAEVIALRAAAETLVKTLRALVSAASMILWSSDNGQDGPSREAYEQLIAAYSAAKEVMRG